MKERIHKYVSVCPACRHFIFKYLIVFAHKLPPNSMNKSVCEVFFTLMVPCAFTQHMVCENVFGKDLWSTLPIEALNKERGQNNDALNDARHARIVTVGLVRKQWPSSGQ